MVETSAVPVKNPAAAGRTVDGQAVIAMSDQAKVVVLNDVGTRVWNLVDGRRTIEEIVGLVKADLAKEDYEQLPQDLMKDVQDFLEDLASRGMVTMGEGER